MQIQTDGILPELPDEMWESSSCADVGIAVDVGTTTVAVNVWSLSEKKCIAVIAEKNCQVKYGADVIRRISFATRPPLTGSSQVVESGPSALHYAIVHQLEKMFIRAVSLASSKLARGVRIGVSRMVITGNTTMLSFLCAVPVDGLAQAPFKPASLFGFTSTWDDVRYGRIESHSGALDSPTHELLETFALSVIPSETPVYFPPCIGAFIGADIVCSMISAGIPSPVKNDVSEKKWEAPVKGPILLADIGTNTEIVLYTPASADKSARILCTSAAAGPAFEGGNISCGMSSVDGAIDKVSYNGNLVCHVIGEIHAKGLCGSGVVSAVSVLLEKKFIDKAGVIQKSLSKLGDGTVCISLTPAVYLSQQDIRNVQLAKSAVFTGLDFMLEKVKSTPVFCLAGGFGSHIEVSDACKIGLIPRQLENRCVHLGNASLAGASAMLFSKTLRHQAAEIAKSAFQINLAGVPGFQKRYLDSIEF